MPLIQGLAAGCIVTFLLLQQRQRTAVEDGATGRAAPERDATSASAPPKPSCEDLPQLTDDQKDALASTAQTLATRGKGILAADESTPTVILGNSSATYLLL